MRTWFALLCAAALFCAVVGQDCGEGCAQCEGCVSCNEEGCNQCDTGYRPDKEEAPFNCVNKFCQEIETGDWEVVPDSGCASCEDGRCTKCDDDSYDPNPSEDGPLNCEACPADTGCTCPNGQFLDEDRSCRTCAKKCGTCEESADKCTSCAKGYYKQDVVRETDPDFYNCQPCQEDCAECESETKCTSCETSGWNIYKGTCVEICSSTNDMKYVSDGVCYESCPSGTHAGEGDNNYVCYTDAECDESCDCDPVTGNCLTCKNSGDKINGNECVATCPEDKALVDVNEGISTCVAQCPDARPYNNDGTCVEDCTGATYGTTENNVRVCKSCGEKCATCESDKKCLTCVDEGETLYINGGYCTDSCPTGTYTDTGNGVCVRCGENCAQCTSEECTVCDSTHYDADYKDDTVCETECTDNECHCEKGYFDADTRKCVPCNDGCAECTEEGCTSCDVGFYNNNESPKRQQSLADCQPCNENDAFGHCAECSAEECTLCEQGYYSKDGKKCSESIDETNCPDDQCECAKTNMYFDAETGMCKDCGEGCATCDSTDACTSCDVDSGYYNTDSEGGVSCAKCSGDFEGCFKCNLDDGCTACDEDHCGYTEEGVLICEREIDNGKCTCGEGEFFDTVSRSCKTCATGCETCISADKCTKCATGYYQESAPVVSRNSNEFVCYSCAGDDAYGQCAECSADECTLCKEGYYSKDGEKCNDETDGGNCPNSVCQCAEPNMYFDAESRMCKDCGEGCAACNADGCTACDATHYDNGSHEGITCEDLVSECPDKGCECSETKMYYDSVSHICKSCGEGLNCGACENGQSCTKCDEGFYDPNPSEDEPLNCVECTNGVCSCPNGQFLDDDRSCRACADECGTCEESADKCTSCATGYYDKEDVAVRGAKVYNCQKCSDNCAACNSDTECTSCKTTGWMIYKGTCVESCSTTEDRKYVSDGKCYEKCPDGTHPGEGEDQYVCYTDEECDESCDCDPVTGNCVECHTSGYKIYGKECVEKCPQGYLVDVNEGISTCVEECPVARPYNNDGTCVEECTGNTYASTDKLVCESCGTDCASCESDEKCLACVDDKGTLYIDGGACVESCPAGTYTDTTKGVCVSCGTNCAQCTSEKCTSCRALTQEETEAGKEALYIDGANCVFNCPTGKALIDEGECVAECPEARPYNNNGKCVKECTGATYTDTTKGVCVSCGNNCAQCDSEKCSGCRALEQDETGALYIDGAECVFKCPNDRAFVDEGKCVANCPSGRQYTYEGKCYDACPTGTHNEEGEYTCQKNPECPNYCNCADGGYICESCKTAHFTLASECTECEDGYGGSTCSVKCNTACTACDDSSDCSACEGNYDPANKCASCKSGYGGSTCSVTCNAACTACDDSSDCTACEGNYDPANKCASCKSGYGGSTCSVTCNAACSACDDSSDCTECSDALLDPEQACGACIAGYYNSAEEGQPISCSACDFKCGTCSEAADKCDSCAAGFYNNAEEGQPVSCAKCNAECATCVEGPDTCESCADGYFNSNTEDGVTCTVCDAKCGTCSEAADKCESCAAGYFNSAEDEDGVSCEPCGEGCSKCTSVGECSECKNPDHFINNGACVESCPAGTYHEEGQKICKAGGGGGGETPRPASNPVASPSSSEEGSNAGMIVGIVIGCIAVAALVGAGIYCFVTAGAKRGKIDPVIYEEDPEFISMSVL